MAGVERKLARLLDEKLEAQVGDQRIAVRRLQARRADLADLALSATLTR